MEVKIISKESIKPSSPTPSHLRTFKLSLLDHLIPAPYAPIVLFYAPHTHLNSLQTLAILKQSLSKTLTRFYPLAGVVIDDDLNIDCNDEGACFVEAEVNCHLSEYLDHPDLHLINGLLPCEPSSSAGNRVTNVQVNVFQCGGIAIGLCISHKIIDGSALSTFLRGWANAAQASKDDVISPDFLTTSSLFPTNDDMWMRDSSTAMWGSLFKVGKCVTRRFVFGSAAIAALKAKASTTSPPYCPTRVEAVSGLIWKCAMSASAKRNGLTRPSLLTHLVNLRRRTSPPLSNHSMGNLIWIASAQCMAKDYEQLGLHALVAQIHDAIQKIDGDFVKKLRSGNEESANSIRKTLKKIGDTGSSNGGDYYGFTSWCKFGFYEVDFGWGRPIWVGGASLGGSSVFLNLSILMDTRCGEGIEAWVNLDEQEMNILEHDLEFRSYALVDPSPLALAADALVISS